MGKIIELEKFKVEREEIDKLEERMNQNISEFKETRQGVAPLQMLKTAAVQMQKKGYGHIKIDDSLDTPTESEDGECHRDSCEPIEEVNEAEEESAINVSEGDSILEEVDRYLEQWRGQK